MQRFCTNPFNRIAIKGSGKVFFCCTAWLNQPIGNIFQQPFHEIWNSPTAVKIRESILDGNFKFCDKDKCHHLVSGAVEDKVEDNYFLDIIRERKVHLDKGPGLICLNYDFSCNFYCKSCRQQVKVLGKEKQEKLIRFQDELITSDLFKNAKRLVISGVGEPFASKVFMDLMTRKLTQVQHPNIKISLRTNGSLLTPENWERIKNVHYAIDSIVISIDAATKKNYRELRRGGDFNRLLKNLKFLKKLKNEKIFNLALCFVVQKTNYREMPDFVKMAKKFNSDEVTFSKLVERDFHGEGYLEDAVHQPDHPEFHDFKKILGHPLLKDPIVNLSNLSNLKE